MSSFSKNRRFHMERLEDRRMMAGDVFAHVDAGTLFIDEAVAGEAQNVSVQQLPNGNFRLTSFTSNTNPTGSKILDPTGKDLGAAEFSGVGKIRIRLGDGSDAVHMFKEGNLRTLQTVEINTAGATLSQNDNDQVIVQGMILSKLDIRTGAGNDDVEVRNTEVARTSGVDNGFIIETGVISSANDRDRDVVRIDGVIAQGVSSVNTGASADFVSIKRSTLGFEAKGSQPSQSTMISTGAGADIVKLGSDGNDLNVVVTRGNLIINTGADSQDDADSVQMRDVEVDGTLFVDLGGGADQLDMVSVVAQKNIEINAMKGNDKAVLNDVQAFDKFFANMGEGDDTLDMTFVRGNNRLEANGGLGSDRLLFSQMNEPALSGWEVINGKPQRSFWAMPEITIGPASR